MDMNKLGLALSGFGAGVQGRLPEFQQGLANRDEQQKKLSEERRQAALLDNRVILDHINNGRVAEANQLIDNRIQGISQLGGDPSDSMEYKAMLEAGDIEGLRKEAMRVDREAVLRGMLPEMEVAGPTLVKNSEINESGQITQMAPDGTLSTKNIPGFKIKDVAKASEGKASAVTKIFDNGTTVQALPNGKVVVKGPDGQPVEGDARLDALAQAREEEIEFQKTKSGATAAGSAAIAQSTKAFTRIAEVKTSISNIDKAIAAIDEGAGTGPVRSKLPSIKASSIKLDNIQRAMGLDVIGDTTFGALSKGELDLALSKALPTKLKPAALREWLVEKKTAQEKLSAYLEDAAIYLGTPGNDVAGWLEAQRAVAGTQEPESGIQEGQTATNPTTGEKLIFRGGQWQAQ